MSVPKILYYVDSLIEFFEERSSEEPEKFNEFKKVLDDFYQTEMSFDFYSDSRDYMTPTESEITTERKVYEDFFEEMHKSILDSPIVWKLNDRIDRVSKIGKKLD